MQQQQQAYCEFQGYFASENSCTPISNGIFIRCPRGIGKAVLTGFSKDQPLTILLNLKALESFTATPASSSSIETQENLPTFQYHLTRELNHARLMKAWGQLQPQDDHQVSLNPIPIVIPTDFLQKCGDIFHISWIDVYR